MKGRSRDSPREGRADPIRTPNRLALVAVTLLVAAACSSASPPSQSPVVSPTSHATPTPTVAVASPSPGAGANFTVGGARPTTVFVPPGLDTKAPAPLLMLLHGYSGSGDEYEDWFHLGPLAAGNGMLYVHPDGTTNSYGRRFWNATDACCDLDASGVDDSAYLSGLIAEIRARVAVDPGRVYVIGHSNGAFMTYRMACDHADTIAAVISLAGASFKDPSKCHPSQPVAVLEIHGDQDAQIRMAGGNAEGVIDPGVKKPADYPSTKDTLAAWAGYDGCTSGPAAQPATFDLDQSLQGPNGPNETTVSAYSGCAPEGAVELWTINGGSHDPILTPNFGVAVIDWFVAHARVSR